MYEVECTLQVDIDDCIPLGLCHAQHESVLGDACIVDQYVYATEVLAYLLHYVLCFSKVCCVSCIGTACHSHGFYLLACGFQSSSHVVVENQVGECNVGTFRCELQGDSLSDTSCRTCNQSGLSFQ